MNIEQFNKLFLSEQFDSKEFITNILLNVFPIILDKYEEIFIDLSDITQKHIHRTINEKVPNAKYLQWNKLYLKPSKLNKKFDEFIVNKINKITKKQLKTKNNVVLIPTKETINQLFTLTSEVPDIQDFIPKLNQLIYDICHPNSDFSKKDLKFAKDIKYFIEASIGRILNLASYIIYKKNLTTLISEVIYQNKYSNLEKIASIDPTIFNLTKVKKYISNLDYDIRVVCQHYPSEYFTKSIMDKNKNHFSTKAIIAIYIFDILILFELNKPFTIPEIRDIADSMGILHEFEELSYFDKLTKSYIKDYVKK